jgi:hypothetical protein
MTTSIEYEEKAQYHMDNIDDIGMKAVELARLYTKLAEVAAIREQTEVFRQNRETQKHNNEWIPTPTVNNLYNT